MVDVTGSASRVQARRVAPRWVAAGAAAMVLCLGTAVPAQDRLPPAPGSVGAIRRDANGQIVPVEPLDPPQPRARRPTAAPARSGAPAGPATASPGAAAEPARVAVPAPGPAPEAPNLAIPGIHCGSAAVACAVTRVTGTPTADAFVTIMIVAAPGTIPDVEAVSVQRTEPADAPAQLDALSHHDDGSVRLALVTAVLARQAIARGGTIVLTIAPPGPTQSIRVRAS